VRGVFDHDEAAPLGQRQDGVHVARMAAVVQDEDRLRPLRESCLHVRRVEVEVVRACDVAEDGRGSGVHDRVRRRDEVQRREDDLVSVPAAGGEQGEVEGGGAVRDGDRVACAGELGERLLELLDARAHAPPARTHDCEHVVDELLADGDVGERLPANPKSSSARLAVDGDRVQEVTRA